MKKFDVEYREYNTVEGEIKRAVCTGNNKIEAKIDFQAENGVVVVKISEREVR